MPLAVAAAKYGLNHVAHHHNPGHMLFLLVAVRVLLPYALLQTDDVAQVVLPAAVVKLTASRHGQGLLPTLSTWILTR